MLRLSTLPAGHGDCLWLEYGDPRHPHRVLIDGGTKGTYRASLLPKLETLPADQRRFELLVVTHIDADHIAGALELLAAAGTGFAAEDVWFNGYRHLPDETPDTLGPIQGERLTDLLVRPGVHWNGAFGGAAVVVPPDGELPRCELAGGLILTLLSPTPRGLADLKPTWAREVAAAGLDPRRPAPPPAESPEGFALLGGPPDVDGLVEEPFTEDAAEANGSSIALLAEYEGRRLLLTGDAHPSVLRSSLDRLRAGRRLALDACKLPHHGSKGNVSRPLLEAIESPVYLFSTSGAYFRHPNREAVARVIKWGGSRPTLAFNYRTDYTAIWDNARLRDERRYSTVFPTVGANGVALEWS